MEGGDTPKIVFDHCAETPSTRKVKLYDFIYQSMDNREKNHFWYPSMSGVIKETNLLRGTKDFLDSLFYIFPYNEILKVYKSKILLDIWNQHTKNTSEHQILAK